MAKAKAIRVEYFSPQGKSVIIPFEDWFGEANKGSENFMLSLVSKKSYSKLDTLICNENNNILNRNRELTENFLYSYMVVKKGLDAGNYQSNPEHFISDVITQIVTPDLVQEVRDYVEESYSINVDKDINLETHKYDPGTTFMDRHFKIMYTISNLCRLITPLCTHFVHVSMKMDSKKFFYDAFMNIFRIVQLREDMDIYSKLHTFVQRAVQKTRKVDDQMWGQLTIFATTPESSIEDAMRRLITDIFPKFVFEQHAMHLIVVVIKQFVKWAFRKEHPFSIHTLSDVEGQGSDDDSIISEADIFDSYNVKRDESILIFRRFFAWDTINKIQMRNGITIEADELEYYNRVPRKWHDLQKFCVMQAFSGPFGGSSNIYGCNRKQYMTLILILSKMMHSLGINSLPDFILGERTKFNYRRISKSFDQLITSNPTYQHLVTTKYEAIQGTFARKDFIRTQIVMIVNNDYSHLRYQNPKNGEMIEKNEEVLLEDVLNFFNLLVV